MKRNAYNSLWAWKNSPRRKPLLLNGARQTGKTWILKEFGRLEYEQLLYCNFEADPQLHTFFEDSLSPKDILQKLSLYKGITIRPGKDLIVFDEIQLSNNALNSLKYFLEDAPEYHVCGAGSLLGIKLSTPKSFPVGKVSFVDIFPMTFLEFLDAVGESRYREMLENTVAITPYALPFHDHLLLQLKNYYIVGGMPEAVSAFSAGGSLEEIRSIQSSILRTYVQDFVKHTPSKDIPKLSKIWDSIPTHLARENKKFIFSAIASGARSREYEDALIWLSDAGLINRCFAVEHIEQPLAGFSQNDAFKVYGLDIGLLGAMAGISPRIITLGNDLFSTYHGAFVENYVAQQLTSQTSTLNKTLYYWKSKSGQAEVDFILNKPPNILPLEVKAGINPRSKSLATYEAIYHPEIIIRSTLLNLKHDGRILNIPLYAIELIDIYLNKIPGSSSSR